MQLTKDHIFKATPKTLTVRVPEWGGEVTIRALTAHAVATWSDEGAESVGEKLTNVRSIERMASLVAISVLDVDGNLMFSRDDVKALVDLGVVPLKRVFNAALKLNALDQDEEFVKNSDADLAGASSSSSP